MLPSYFTETRDVLEQMSQQRHQTALLSDQAVLCRVLGRYIFYADPSDVGITPHLCLDGYWESWITLALARIIDPVRDSRFFPGARCPQRGPTK